MHEFICIHKCVYIRKYMYVYMYIYVCICAYAYVCMYTFFLYIYTYKLVLLSLRLCRKLAIRRYITPNDFWNITYELCLLYT